MKAAFRWRAKPAAWLRRIIHSVSNLCTCLLDWNHVRPSAKAIRKDTTSSDRQCLVYNLHGSLTTNKRTPSAEVLVCFNRLTFVIHSGHICDITITSQSNDVLWALHCSLCQTTLPRKPTATCTHRFWNAYSTLSMTIVFISLTTVQSTVHLPFTVFTKTCFSLLGSFSSSSTPWKMRPNVPVKDKKHMFYWRERAGVREPEASHSKTEMWPHSLAGMPGWSVDRGRQASAKNALSRNSIRQFWLLSHWQEPFRGAQRSFHHLEPLRATYNMKRPSERVHRLLCINCHPIAPRTIHWGEYHFTT